jgi:hypothetical protein
MTTTSAEKRLYLSSIFGRNTLTMKSVSFVNRWSLAGVERDGVQIGTKKKPGTTIWISESIFSTPQTKSFESMYARGISLLL